MWFVYPQGLSYHSGDGRIQPRKLERCYWASANDGSAPAATYWTGQLILLGTRMHKHYSYVVSLSIQPPRCSAERQCATAPSGSALTGHLAPRSANTRAWLRASRRCQGEESSLDKRQSRQLSASNMEYGVRSTAVKSSIPLAVYPIPRATGFGPASRFLYHYLRQSRLG